jgi:hypothetical protein
MWRFTMKHKVVISLFMVALLCWRPSVSLLRPRSKRRLQILYLAM